MSRVGGIAGRIAIGALSGIRMEPPGDRCADASTFLLIHGLHGGAEQWWSVGQVLAKHGPVLSVNLRGHDCSPVSDDLDVATQAGEIAEIVGQLGGPVHIAGASFGGVLALAVASGRARRIASVSTLGTAIDPPSLDLGVVEQTLRKMGRRPFFELIARNYSFGPSPSPEQVAHAIQLAAERDIEAICRVMRIGMKASCRPYTGSVHCPVQIMVGEHDQTCPPDRVGLLADCFGVPLKIVKGGGHLVHVERPEAVASAILELALRAEAQPRIGTAEEVRHDGSGHAQ